VLKEPGQHLTTERPVCLCNLRGEDEGVAESSTAKEEPLSWELDGEGGEGSTKVESLGSSGGRLSE
jgi:hypothetical protein